MRVVSVVDDDASVRSSTVDLLDSIGLACEAFPSAQAYLASGRLVHVSCQILDVSMPGLSGIDLLRQLVNAGHAIPTIFITAFPEERTRVLAASYGAICYLPKPYGDEELLACIREALERDPTS